MTASIEQQIAFMDDCVRGAPDPDQRAMNSAILATLKDHARLQQDARRYQALRNEGVCKLNGLYVADAKHDWRGVCGEELDTTIDSALEST